MPSPRKRIGFLPSLEVQNIIDEICIHNKLSQSKVTGILVEEALNSRGLLKCNIHKISSYNRINYDSGVICTDNFIGKSDDVEDNNFSNIPSIKDEVQMINDFIEFKFFKNIMNKNKKNI